MTYQSLFPQIKPISKVAQSILEKRYFSEGETTWDDVVKRVINHLFDDDYENKQLLYELILNTYVVPNSPCLVNAGKSTGGLCACFVVDFPDTIEGIYKTKLDFALIARKGGGCGTTLSKIRPEGSKVAGSTHGYAGGAVKFADTISHDADALTQSGFRSMAIMFVMSVYHPDLIKFITAKSEEDKITNANISVMVDDNFMQKVINDETYWTEFNGVKYQEYKAKDIFNLIVEGAWRNGEPGMLYKDRIDDSPYKYTGQEILATNPCIHKDTYMLDNDKINKISHYNHDTFTSWKTGIKECIKLITNAGHEIIVTPDHKVMLEDESFIDSKDSLNKSIKWGLGNRKLSSINKNALLLGFLFGDGFLAGKKQGISVKINPEKEFEVAELLKHYGFYQENNGAFYINRKTLEDKLEYQLDFLNSRVYDREIPDNILTKNTEFLGSFLKGLFEANGSVTISNSQISLKTTCHKTAKIIQIILASFEIQSWIVRNKPVKIHWKNGDYTSRESYNVQIAPRNSLNFYKNIGFYSSIKNSRIKTFDKKYNKKLKVIKIENVGEQEVWDFSNDVHYNFANGFIVHNCGEQPLPFNGVCNLASIDISKFYNCKTDSIDYLKLEVATQLTVEFLDQVIDKTAYPTPEIEKWAKENRAIGTGIMGFADYCLLRKIAYGSEESIKELEKILSFISQVTEKESVELGQKYGIPKMCQMLPVPRRNITLMTIAPTGTTSIIAGCSSGIEPIFSEITVRNDKTGTYTFVNDLAQQPYFRCAVSADGGIEVTWEEHIDILTAAQKHIDSGVSKTINFPTHTHRETIGKAFIMAWEKGAKGLAVYRNGSRKVEVLSPRSIKKDLCPSCKTPLIIIKDIKKCPSCNFSIDKQ